MRSLSIAVALVVVLSAFAASASAACGSCDAKDAKDANSGWVSLFNGKDLTGWVPKIRGYKLGENYADTFRVEDGVIKVRYDKYEGKFNSRFGHLFYKKPFKNYILRVEYRFVGEQAEGGPGWAFRNSGVMIHGQDPNTMGVGQSFPVSIEVQLLGGAEKGERPTANLCTPGTHVVLDGKLHKPHVVKSKSKTYRGDQWVTVEIEARGNVIKHKIDGKTVLEYTDPQLDEGGDAKKLIAAGAKKMLTGGSISLQAESHPCEFRKVEIKKLPD
jgi:hypothetical protein